LRRYLIHTLLLVFMCAVPVHASNIVINPSFETPLIPNGSFSLFSSIPGWNLASGPSIEIQNHVAGSPFDGNQFVELDSTGESAIFQDLATLPGTAYQLSFAFSPRPGVAVNSLQVLWAGTPVTTINSSGVGLPDTSWTVYTFNLTATAATTRLQFSGLGPSDSLGEYVDAVSVSDVPEPSSVVLCMAGLAIAAVSRKKLLHL